MKKSKVVEIKHQEPPMIDIVRQFLEEHDWQYDEKKEDEDKIGLSVTFRMDNGRYNTYFNVDQKVNHFWISSYASVFVPESRRLQVCELIVRLNHRLYLSRMEMDMEEGEICMVSVAYTKGNTLTHDMIKAMQSSVLDVLDDHMPSVMNVAHNGVSPVDALKQFDRESNPEESVESKTECMVLH